MQAGIELNRLVAEKVMGLKFFHNVKLKGVDGPAWIASDGTPYKIEDLNYSRDVSCALDVMQRIDEIGGIVSHRFREFYPHDELHESTAEGFPVAPAIDPLNVCLSALKAIESTKESPRDP